MLITKSRIDVYSWNTPNVVIECTALLSRFAQDTGGSPSSNLCPETGHPACDFSWLSLVYPGKCRDSYNRFFPHTPQFTDHRTFCMDAKNVSVTSKENHETDSTSHSGHWRHLSIKEGKGRFFNTEAIWPIVFLLPTSSRIHLQRRHASYRWARPLPAKAGTITKFC